MDEIDLKILKVLQANGRIPNSELALLVCLSPSQCLRRLRRLENKGVIRGYVALLDHASIGLGVQAFVNVTLEKHGRDPAQAFASAIGDWDEILECWAVTGGSDYLLRVTLPGLNDFSELLMKRLLALPMVAGVKSNILLQELKGTTQLPLNHLT
tara:strand:- start:908 stop:1372 length:465 start_codon:yes stop_codon:yes gene_type:complete